MSKFSQKQLKRMDAQVQQTQEHQYPCRNWLEEKSCVECRQIADERSYWTDEEWKAFWEASHKQK